MKSTFAHKLLSVLLIMALYIPIVTAQTIPLRAGTYAGKYGSIARIERRAHQVWLTVTSRPQHGRGSATGADCELRAKYNDRNKAWELTPFNNGTMSVNESDLYSIEFLIINDDYDSFNLNTNFANIGCAAGVFFETKFRLVSRSK